jgi:K+-sensing histidine kinase KdpD
VLELSNIVMLFLLTVVGVGLAHGRGPAVLAAFLGVGLFRLLLRACRASRSRSAMWNIW